ncbi:MAG: RNA 2',3'-cyclic phosphodiesterase [Acidobacteriia bacterium]|nr:RNA 2',3'-cyclic phosphodiesterase [Terriglobia bacterium]
MRLFIALDIPAKIRARLTEYMERARKLAPDARWARVEGLHVTLKFVGTFSDARLEEMKAALTAVKAARFEVKFKGVGFFPNPKAARVFWAAVDGGEQLPCLALAIDAALEGLGIAREEKPYHPHLTLARASSRPLRELQSLLTDPQPQFGTQGFGTMTAREFFLYQSQPQKGGSKYTKLERFRLE